LISQTGPRREASRVGDKALPDAGFEPIGDLELNVCRTVETKP
jgi:hypothetical protein